MVSSSPIFLHITLIKITVTNFNNSYYRQAIVITDGASRWASKTSDEAHLCRDNGITLTAVGIKGANYDELHNIAGDASRVFNVTDFDQLGGLINAIEKTTCTGILEKFLCL